MAELEEALKAVHRALKAPRGSKALIVTLQGDPDETQRGIWAYPSGVPGLVVHRTVGRSDKWTLTHENTTQSIMAGLRTKRDCIALAAELRDAAPDVDFARTTEADLIDGYFTDATTFVKSFSKRESVLEVRRRWMAGAQDLRDAHSGTAVDGD